MSAIHVAPLNDLVEHDSSTDEPVCVCGPTIERVEGTQGDGWLIVHHSLDGRESNDQRGTG